MIRVGQHITIIQLLYKLHSHMVKEEVVETGRQFLLELDLVTGTSGSMEYKWRRIKESVEFVVNETAILWNITYLTVAC